MSENKSMEKVGELFCYKLTLRFDFDTGIAGDSNTEELFVVAPSLTEACAYAYEFCSEIVKTEYCGVGAVWSRTEDCER